MNASSCALSPPANQTSPYRAICAKSWPSRKAAQFDLIILETSGIGQSDTEIVDFSDLSLYVMTPDYGAATQLEKIDMLDFADIIAINKFDKRGALDGLRDVKKQFRRNHQAWDIADDELPVFGTIASQFNDPGTNRLYRAVMQTISEKCAADLWPGLEADEEPSSKVLIIPPARSRYLSEISTVLRAYDKWTADQAKVANQLYGIRQAAGAVQDGDHLLADLEELYEQTSLKLEEKNQPNSAGLGCQSCPLSGGGVRLPGARPRYPGQYPFRDTFPQPHSPCPHAPLRWLGRQAALEPAGECAG